MSQKSGYDSDAKVEIMKRQTVRAMARPNDRSFGGFAKFVSTDRRKWTMVFRGHVGRL
jgi:hypothetical protein